MSLAGMALRRLAVRACASLVPAVVVKPYSTVGAGLVRTRLPAVTQPLFARGFRVNMEPTPNPDSMKFVPEGKIVLPEELGTGKVGPVGTHSPTLR